MDALLAGADSRADGRTCLLTFGQRGERGFASELRRCVRAAARRGAARIVLAVNGTSLLSADVLDALRTVGIDLAAEGRSLAVVCPDPRLRRLLDLTALSSSYELWPSLDEAAAA